MRESPSLLHDDEFQTAIFGAACFGVVVRDRFSLAVAGRLHPGTCDFLIQQQGADGDGAILSELLIGGGVALAVSVTFQAYAGVGIGLQDGYQVSNRGARLGGDVGRGFRVA